MDGEPLRALPNKRQLDWPGAPLTGLGYSDLLTLWPHLAMAFKLLLAAEKCWQKVNAPHLGALVKAGVKFPNSQAEMFQLEKPDDDLLLSLTPSISAAREVSIHNI